MSRASRSSHALSCATSRWCWSETSPAAFGATGPVTTDPSSVAAAVCAGSVAAMPASGGLASAAGASIALGSRSTAGVAKATGAVGAATSAAGGDAGGRTKATVSGALPPAGKIASRSMPVAAVASVSAAGSVPPGAAAIGAKRTAAVGADGRIAAAAASARCAGAEMAGLEVAGSGIAGTAAADDEPDGVAIGVAAPVSGTGRGGTIERAPTAGVSTLARSAIGIAAPGTERAT